MTVKRKLFVFVLTLIFAFSLFFLFEKPSEKAYADDDVTVVMAFGDYQAGNGSANSHDQTSSTFSAILNSVKKDYSSIYGSLCIGDYSAAWTNEDVNLGISYLNSDLTNSGLGFQQKIYLQGNHDPANMMGKTASGPNDPANNAYGVFVINEDDYMWKQGVSSDSTGTDISTHEQAVKDTADNLRAYLEKKSAERYDKPIFIVSHLALNYSFRTYQDGDAQYARYIFNAIWDNVTYGGLNIIFLYGHNHSHGWDNYLGGANVYLKPGDMMKIGVIGDRYSCEEVPLNFTYMNAGYVGYYSTDDANDGANRDLTVSVFEIRNNKVTIKRYCESGQHDLKSKGVYNTRVVTSKDGGTITEQEYGQYTPNTTIYQSGQVLTLNKKNKYVMQRYGHNYNTDNDEYITSSNFSNRKIYLTNPSGENPLNFALASCPTMEVSASFKITGKVSDELWGKAGIVFTNGTTGFFVYMDAAGDEGEGIDKINNNGVCLVRMINGKWDWDTSGWIGGHFDKNGTTNLKIIREYERFYILVNDQYISEITTDTMGLSRDAYMYAQVRSFNIKLELTNYENKVYNGDFSKLSVVYNSVLGDTPYNTSQTTWDLSQAYEKTNANFANRKAVLSVDRLSSSNELFFNTSSSPQLTVEATFKVTGKSNSELWGKFGFSYVNKAGNGFFFYVDAQGGEGTAVSDITGAGVGVVIREFGNHMFNNPRRSLYTGGLFDKNKTITLKMVRDYEDIYLYVDNVLQYSLKSTNYGIEAEEELYPSIKSYGIALNVTNYDCIGRVDNITLDGNVSDWMNLAEWDNIYNNRIYIQDYQDANRYARIYTLLTEKGLFVLSVASHYSYIGTESDWWKNNNFEYFFNGNGTYNQFFASSQYVRGFSSFYYKCTKSGSTYLSVFEGFISADTLNIYIDYNGSSIRYGAAFKINNDNGTYEDLKVDSSSATSYWMMNNSNPRDTAFTIYKATDDLKPVTPPASSSSSSSVVQPEPTPSSSSSSVVEPEPTPSSSSSSSSVVEPEPTPSSSSSSVVEPDSSKEESNLSSTTEESSSISSSIKENEESSQSSDKEDDNFSSSSNKENSSSKVVENSNSNQTVSTGCGSSIGAEFSLLFILLALFVVVKLYKKN